MTKENKLRDALWSVANEYARQTAELLEVSEWYWVGANNKKGYLDVCDFGGTTFLDLGQMQVIIDRMPDWIERYGSRDAVRQEVADWLEWSLKECNLFGGHPIINLEHWLMGCPREPVPQIERDILALTKQRDILNDLVTEYGINRSLGNVLTNIEAKRNYDIKRLEDMRKANK